MVDMIVNPAVITTSLNGGESMSKRNRQTEETNEKEENIEKINDSNTIVYEGVFEAIEPSKGGGGARLDIEKVKSLLDEAEKCLDSADAGKIASISLAQFNSIVGTNRTSTAGISDTFNKNYPDVNEYLREKGLKFGDNRVKKIVTIRRFQWSSD